MVTDTLTNFQSQKLTLEEGEKYFKKYLDDPYFKPLQDVLLIHFDEKSLALIFKAYDYAKAKHEGQFRKSGEPFIIHPVATAVNLANLGMPYDTIAAGLLHDILEDTDTPKEDLEKNFGPEILNIVDGVTKIDKLKLVDDNQAESIKKMILAMSNDIRVLIVKLADRLHNARTWEFLPLDRSEYKARETLEIYAPLADRFGLNSWKLELQDLSLKVLEPQIYDELSSQVTKYAPEMVKLVGTFIEEIQRKLKAEGIEADISGRPKHIYSIYRKMVTKHYNFRDIYDLVGIRIIVDQVKDCYGALGIIHSTFPPMHSRFKDYIAMPKFNGYQSLHTTVIAPNGKPAEIQIRTKKMHENSEFGVAAHWKYKERIGTDDKNSDSTLNHNLKWIKTLTDWKDESKDSIEFLDQLRYDLTEEEIYVFTPQGKVISLPENSTPIDFAYAVHTEVGDKAMGAKVDGKLVPLSTKLKNGNTVEINVSKALDAHPNREWLTFVSSPRAKNKIRQFFQKEKKEESIEHGKKKLSESLMMKKLPLKKILTQNYLMETATSFNYKDVDNLYYALGEGHISSDKIISKILEVSGETDVEEALTLETTIKPKTQLVKVDNYGIIIKGIDTVWLRLAKCCTPVPPDKIGGFITKGYGVTVHRTDCKNYIAELQENDRVVDAEWDEDVSTSFLVQIEIKALDRTGLLADILKVFADDKISVDSINAQQSKSQIHSIRAFLNMSDPKILPSVLNQIRKIDSVFDVSRV